MTLTLSEAGQNVVAGTFGKAMKRAGEALGSMSGQVIEVQTPMLKRCSAADVLAMAGGPESVVLAVYVGINGSLEGHALLLFSPADAHRLAADPAGRTARARRAADGRIGRRPRLRRIRAFGSPGSGQRHHLRVPQRARDPSARARHAHATAGGDRDGRRRPRRGPAGPGQRRPIKCWPPRPPSARAVETSMAHSSSCLAPTASGFFWTLSEQSGYDTDREPEPPGSRHRRDGPELQPRRPSRGLRPGFLHRRGGLGSPDQGWRPGSLHVAERARQQRQPGQVHRHRPRHLPQGTRGQGRRAEPMRLQGGRRGGDADGRRRPGNRQAQRGGDGCRPQRARVSLAATALGGNAGRTVQLEVSDGRFLIKSLSSVSEL
jgi:hypothetical protein